MKELRPVVETGYENILLGRLLIEEVGARASWRDRPAEAFTGMNYGRVLAVKEPLLFAWGENRSVPPLHRREAQCLRQGDPGRVLWFENDFASKL